MAGGGGAALSIPVHASRAVAAIALLFALICMATGARAAQSGRYVVIRNLNPPQQCRVVREDAAYIAIYAQVFGPARKAAAEAWARKNCPPARR